MNRCCNSWRRNVRRRLVGTEGEIESPFVEHPRFSLRLYVRKIILNVRKAGDTTLPTCSLFFPRLFCQ